MFGVSKDCFSISFKPHRYQSNPVQLSVFNPKVSFVATLISDSIISLLFVSSLEVLEVTNSTANNPLPDDKILDGSKLKEIADYILKCIENEI